MIRVKGFTLIELLIVIAIILILIAIALPNFLEAQIRAKVANINSELRSLEVALTSYQIDHKRYMADGFEYSTYQYPGYNYGNVEGHLMVYSQLTTPHAYMTSIPTDDFFSASSAVDAAGAGAGSRDPNNRVYRYYSSCWRCLAAGIGATSTDGNCPVPASVKGRVTGSPFDPNAVFTGEWIMLSAGPDASHSYGEWAMAKHVIASGNFLTYSPTNGTVSFGDIHRSGK